MRAIQALTGLTLTFALVACGGGTPDEGAMDDAPEAATETAPAPATAPAGLSMPDWMTVDEASQSVTMEVHAGESEANNRWNYNGLYAGNGEIVVPAGYSVTINFTNADPNQPHSVGIGEPMDTWPAVFESPQPVFEGAMSPDATTTGTPMGGGTATIRFTAGAAGEYAMICYIPGHAVAGMVVPFTVSSDGSAGVRS